MVVLRDLQLVYVFNYVSILMCSQRPKSWKLIPLPPESVTSFDMPWYSCLWMCFSKFPMGLLVGGQDESLISQGIWRFKIQNKLCDRVLLFGRSNTFLWGRIIDWISSCLCLGNGGLYSKVFLCFELIWGELMRDWTNQKREQKYSTPPARIPERFVLLAFLDSLVFTGLRLFIPNSAYKSQKHHHCWQDNDIW